VWWFLAGVDVSGGGVVLQRTSLRVLLALGGDWVSWVFFGVVGGLLLGGVVWWWGVVGGVVVVALGSMGFFGMRPWDC